MSTTSIPPQSPAGADGDPLDDYFDRREAELTPAQPALPTGSIGFAGDALDAYFDSRQKAEETAFMSAFASTLGANPDLAGEAQRLGVQTGLDALTVERNIAKVRQIVAADNARMWTAADRSPILRRKLMDPAFARIASDETRNLSAIERLGAHWRAETLNVERGRIGARVRSGAATRSELDRLAEIDRRLQTLPPAGEGFVSGTTRILAQWSETLPTTIGAALATGAASAEAAALLGQAGPQAAVPEEVVTVPAAFVTGATWGSAAAMAVQSYQIESGSAYLDMVNAGYDHDVASRAAVGVGLANAALEVVGAGLVARGAGLLTRPLKDVLKREAAQQVVQRLARPVLGSPAVRFAKDVAIGVGGEVLTETMQTAVNVTAEEIARRNSANPDALESAVTRGEVLEQLIDTAVQTAQGMALIGTAGPAFHFARSGRKARAAQAEGRTLDDLGRLARESKVRGRNPQEFEGFLRDVVQDTGAENLYVDAEQFAQAMRETGTTPERLAELVPDVARQVADARTTGADVVVPTEQFFAHLHDSDFGRVLLQHARTDPDGASRQEGATFHQEIRENADRMARLAEQHIAADTGFLRSGDAVEESLRQQIADTKTRPAWEAQAGAKLLRTFLDTQAARLGTTPQELHARFPLQVVRGRAGADGLTLTQPGSEGPRASFDPQRFVITLFDKADSSSLLHEGAHYFLSVSSVLADSANATAQMRADHETFLRWAGVDDAATWRGMTLEQQRQHHEAFAYNFESYLYEGKAPSTRLERLFERFASWLRRVYRAVRGELNQTYRQQFGKDLPALTPELRQVMDRMLASEDAVAHAESVRRMVPLFQTREEAGMDPDEWAYYQEAQGWARESSVADLQARSLRQMQWLQGARSRALRELQKRHAGVRAEMRERVAADVGAQPVYRVSSWLEGEGRLHRAQTLALVPEERRAAAQKKLRARLSDDGLAPDLVAQRFGLPSGDRMVRELLAAPPIEKAIDAETDRRMLEQHGDLADPAQVELAVQRALHTEARSRFVAVELQHLAKATQPYRIMLAAAKQAARQVLGRKTLREIRPHLLWAAESRAAGEAVNALRRGDTGRAIEAKRRQLMLNQMARQAIAAREEIGKALRSFDRFTQPDAKLAKTRNVDLVNAARAILGRHNIGTALQVSQALSYLEKVKAYNQALHDEIEPVLQQAADDGRDYRDLTLEEFRALRGTVEQLWFRSRRDQQIRVEGRLVERETAIAEILDRVTSTVGIPEQQPGQRRAVSRRERRGMKLAGLRAALLRVEHACLKLDGGKPGPVTEYVFRELRRRVDDYRGEKNDLVARYRDGLRRLELDRADIDAPELGYTFAGKAELLGAIQHAGNESNFRKLLVGRGWVSDPQNPVGADGLVDRSKWRPFLDRMFQEGKLTEADIDFVQFVWDLNEQLKPAAQRVHHDLYGHFFDEIEATPFVTPWKTYRGGYVPARVDPDLVPEARQREGVAGLVDIERDFRQGLPTTGRGFTKSRVEGYNKPLRLDVRAQLQHFDEALRFIHLQPAVRDVLGLLRDPKLADALNRVDPTLIGDVLMPWLDRTARQQMARRTGVDSSDWFFNMLRRNAGLAIMFANVANSVQQVTGVFNAAVYVKARHLAAAGWESMWAPRVTARRVAELSQFMDQRLNDQVGQILDDVDLMLDPSKLASARRWTNRHGYFAQRFVQNGVDIVSWLGAFRQAMEESGATMTDEEATAHSVAFADGVVRMSQGSTTPEDVAKYDASSPFVRAFTQFSGYMNTVLNQVLGANKGQRLRAFLLAYSLPAAIGTALQQLTWGGWDDEDDDGYLDEVAASLLGSQVRGAAGLLPGVGPGFASLLFSDRPGDRLQLSPGVSSVQSAWLGLSALVERGGDVSQLSGRNVRDLFTAVSMVTGVPVSALSRPWAYEIDVQSGRKQPSGPIDYTRGLLTGR